MRTKDENKKTAICNAAIELINREGFAETSMAKIAKAANVAAATIYIYFENKEELLNQLYLWIKRESSRALFKGFHEDLPVREGIELLWSNSYDYIMAEPEQFCFGEQFANSPLVNRVSKTEGAQYYKPLFKLLDKGIAQGVVKNVPREVLSVYIFAPIFQLAKKQLDGEIKLTPEMIQEAFGLTWDAITV